MSHILTLNRNTANYAVSLCINFSEVGIVFMRHSLTQCHIGDLAYIALKVKIADSKIAFTCALKVTVRNGRADVVTRDGKVSNSGKSSPDCLI